MRRLLLIPTLLAALIVAACSGNATLPSAQSAATANPSTPATEARGASTANQPKIDATALPTAQFTVRRENGNRLAGPISTASVWNAGSLPDGNFYLTFEADATNYYQAVEPERLGNTFIRLKKGKFDFVGNGPHSAGEFFTLSADGLTLALKPDSYTVVEHDLRAIDGLAYRLRTGRDGGSCCDRDRDRGCDGQRNDGNTSEVGHAAFGRGTTYALTFGQRGDELVFPCEPARGYFSVGSGTVSAEGNYGSAYTLTGNSIKLNDGAYVRVRNDNNWGGTPSTWRFTLANGLPFSILNHYDTQAPWGSFVLAGGLKFRVAAGHQQSQVLTVGPGRSIDGFGAKGYSFDGSSRSGVLNVDGGPYPASAKLADAVVLANVGGVDVVNGGFGSGMSKVPGEPYSLYLLTDRGPNIDGAPNEKIFPAPTFNPQIGKFYLYDNILAKDSVILLRDSAGNPRTGLPRPPGDGGNTGEIGKDYAGNVLYDPQGIDSEALVALPDGTFWISDEYGPFILHLAANGTTIEELSPFNGKLPKVLATRRPNKGMEGLTMTPGGTLVGTMQQPLVNPVDNNTIKNGRVGRIVTYKAGVRHEYVYVWDTKDMSSCDIFALSETTFLVDERDGNFGDQPGAIKRIYKIDLTGATDVTDPADSPNGLLYAGKTLEQLTFSGLAAQGIVPVSKTLVYDVVAGLSYPHDKLEGLVGLDGSTFALADDDDFSVIGTSVLTTKYLFDGVTPDFGEVFFVHTAAPFN